MKAVVAAFNQEKALVGAFSMIRNLRMELFEALPPTLIRSSHQPPQNVFIMRPVLVAEAVTSSSTRLATAAGSRAGKLRLIIIIRFSGTRHLVSFSNCVEVLEKEEVRTSGCE